jgi:hypothetical protein
MLLAIEPEDLERFAVPIGIAIALLLFLIIPSWRRFLFESFQQGKEARERLLGKRKPRSPEDEPDDKDSPRPDR